MIYLSEIQGLEYKIRNNYGKINLLEQSRNKIINECEFLQTMSANKIQIDELRWHGLTVKNSQEIKNYQNKVHQSMINQEEHFIDIITEKIRTLETQNEQYNWEIRQIEMR